MVAIASVVSTSQPNLDETISKSNSLVHGKGMVNRVLIIVCQVCSNRY